MEVENIGFGSISIDGAIYEKDIIIDRGKVKKRNKKASKRYRDRFGHTPLSAKENIPWKCNRLVIGTGHSSAMPVMEKVYGKGIKKGVEVISMSTPEAVKHINDPGTNLILHLTC